MSRADPTMPSFEKICDSNGLMFFLSLMVGALAYGVVCGNPLEVLSGGLVIDTDYPNAAAAFEIYVKDGWHWPIGASPNFGGVNIFFSDGAPWLAIVSKLIYHMSGVFVSFHWLTLFNFLAFSFFSYRLACQVSFREEARWLIVVMLVFNLIMPVRMIGAQHIALSSYWVLLWSMSCVPLSHQPEAARWRRWEFLLAISFATLSHAYLAAMSITIVAAFLLWKRRWLALASAFALPMFLLYVVGVFHGAHSVTEGAKAYSLDLLAFFETLGWGLLPNLYSIQEPPQSDAILYLGTGILFLLIVLLLAGAGRLLRSSSLSALGERFRSYGIPENRLALLFIVSLALMGYAMAFDIRVAGRLLASFDIPFVFEPLYQRFRVTGRFAVPMAYCLILLICLLWGRLFSWLPRRFVLLLGVCALALQFGDALVASRKSPPSVWLEDAQSQRNAVASLIQPGAWSGRVYKDVGYFDLENQRMLDLALVGQGANYFAVVHGARLDPEDVKDRSGYEHARSGDVVVTITGEEHPECRRIVEIKKYSLCLVR